MEAGNKKRDKRDYFLIWKSMLPGGSANSLILPDTPFIVRNSVSQHFNKVWRYKEVCSIKPRVPINLYLFTTFFPFLNLNL